MNFKEWVEKYKPVKTEDDDIFAFETYGKSIDFVNENDPHYIWTLCEENGIMFIQAGKCWVNRLNYFLCEVRWDYENGVQYPEPITLEDDDDIDIYFGF